MSGCLHAGSVAAGVTLHYLVDEVAELTPTKPAAGFRAGVSLSCGECGEAFRWLGASVSPDGLELRAPVAPVTEPVALVEAAWP